MRVVLCARVDERGASGLSGGAERAERHGERERRLGRRRGQPVRRRGAHVLQERLLQESGALLLVGAPGDDLALAVLGASQRVAQLCLELRCALPPARFLSYTHT